ncbi:MAG: tRNA (adenosine(37)-N6)-dimethylallyltransferase MiaA [Bacteroidales bacterium]
MRQETNKTLIVLSGPTASGKTGLSIELAKHLKTEICSADSRQFFKEMKIGTAVPSDSQLKAVPHHFIGHLSIHEQYNASRFEHDALAKLNELFAVYDYVILTGGSGMYVDAVCHGIDQMPDVPAGIRKQVDELLQQKGMDFLRDYLQQHDPEYFWQVDKDNPNRMKRGVEMHIATGKPFSDFRRQARPQRPFAIRKFALSWPRALLYERINQRTEQMLANGWLEEARLLLENRALNALKTVGYRELFAFFDGEMSYDQAVEKIKTQTRRYAKRQITWLRRDPLISWVDMTKDEALKNILLTFDDAH